MPSAPWEATLPAGCKLGGKSASLDLAVSDIEFAPEATAEPCAAPDRGRITALLFQVQRLTSGPDA